MTVITRLDNWLLAPAPAERLATLRIAVGGFVLVYMVANVGEVARIARRPVTGFDPVGILSMLDQPAATWLIWTLYCAQILTGLAFTLGAAYRITGPVFAILTLLWASYHSSWGQMLHFEHLFTLHLLVLGFAPAAVVWSLDAQRGSSETKPAVRFGWPVRIMAIITVVTYVLAAVAKLRESGIDWLNGTNLGNHIAYSATRVDLLGGIEAPLAPVVIRWSWLLAPMAIASLIIEFGAPIALISTWLRTGWLIAALAFHLATAATMMVWFPYQGLGFAMLPLVAAEQIPLRMSGLTRRVASA